MVSTNDGFEIAETDLQLRGPGNLMGTQQSGILALKIADVVQDSDILKTARFYAQQLLKNDPGLAANTHKMVREKMARMEVFKNIWDYIS